jgi:hypothetical protein
MCHDGVFSSLCGHLFVRFGTARHANMMPTVSDENESRISGPQSNLSAMMTKIIQRHRLLFVMTCDENSAIRMALLGGDHLFRHDFEVVEGVELEFQLLCGTATSEDTLQQIFHNVSSGLPCETYLNLYTMRGFSF